MRAQGTRARAIALSVWLIACDGGTIDDAGVAPLTDAAARDAGDRDAGGRDAGDRDAAIVTPTGCPAPDAPVAEPYALYPALDLARVPFHVADGPWGARRAIEAPAVPVTTRRVSVATAAELEREGLVPGSEITVTASIDRTVTLLGDVTDLDLIVPTGVRVGGLNLGRASPPSTSRRVRVRGTTPGAHSGGVIGQVVFFSADFEDAILDGVDLDARDGDRHGLAWYIATQRGARFAIVNNRAHAAAAASLHGPVTDLVIAGNHVVSGARSRASNGYPEGWSLRGGRRLVVFGNRLEGNRYHRVRVHPEDDPTEYAWIADNVLVDPYEARIVWAAALSDGASPWDGFWAVCNVVYAHSDTTRGCLGWSFEAPAASYARLTNNVFYGVVDEAGLRARAGSGDQDVTTGNTYHPWEDPPPWGALGDPRDIALGDPPDPHPQDPMCPGP
ncbi:MAG: hypothetical protein KF729_06215 [Sandaracinaceae bacterium]|nr:hypothetical protein [Sandaracinaceae bacterium]